MARLSERASRIRAKNAGPFWVTIDIFFSDLSEFSAVKDKLNNKEVAKVLHQKPGSLKRFDLDSIGVIKISFPRPVVQGNRFDRDMHGAQYACLLADVLID